MSFFPQQSGWRSLAVCVLLFGCLLITGCRGCRDEPGDAQTQLDVDKKKELEKKKPDFVTRSPVLLPGWFPKEAPKNVVKPDPLDEVASARAEIDNSNIRFNRTKLGHWVEAQLPAIANNFNADGQLTTFSTTLDGQPVPIPSTDYVLNSTRPVSLVKAEWKILETSLFLPRRDTKTASANVNYVFDRGTGGIPYISFGQPTSLMKPFQYHIVLLSERPDTYNYLKLIDSIQLRGQHLGSGDVVPPFYYLVPSMFGDPLPLPRHSLNWTTIAYLIWDDYDPDKLSQDHQAALLDWLHFGGQLILSGPDCLDKLQNSFLGNYLPAQFDGSFNLTEADLKELNANWTVPVTNQTAEQRSFQLSDTVPLLGVKFNPHDDAAFVQGTGQLAVERAVGRGRILVTSFSLNAPLVRKWQSFPSFVNNVLLRRPARQFGRTTSADVSFGWHNDSTSIFDPMFGSTLRFISRDLSAIVAPQDPAYSIADEDQPDRGFSIGSENANLENELLIRRDTVAPARNPVNHWHFGGYADTAQSGTGGWNDDSGISIAARETLIESAGITPPSSKFVLKMLAVYLAVLVPLNWLLFRLLGRVEWAWIAAPFIAIVGAVLVVKLAALDIGFVRSNTQIGLLEVQANYQRAHATEYSALYTSLSTRYTVDLDNPTAQSLPFATVNESRFKKPTESYSRVNLKRAVQSRLEGFQIQSNSTGLLHTEFMLDLEGTIYANFAEHDQPTVINNGSVLDLGYAGVVSRSNNGEYLVAWVGDLVSGSASADLKFEITTAENVAALWQDQPSFADSTSDTTNIHVGRLLETILKNLQIAPGECRMLATTEQRLGRTKFEPEATQTDQRTLVVVHLKRPPLPIAQRDVNTMTDFTGKSDLDWQRSIDETDDLFGEGD